jgi:hypothetical protein
MSGKTKQSAKSPAKSPFGTDPDREVSPLPGRSWKSVLGLFAHLESLSRTREPAKKSATQKLNAAPASPAFKTAWTEEAALDRVSYRELGRQMIRSARAQVRSLREKGDQLQALVMINNWAVAERLWSEVLPECKTPLYVLSVLEELWGLNPDRFHAGGWTMRRQWQEFVLIQAEFEILLGRRRSLLEFSDALERDFGHWLSRFVDLLEKLDEASAA